MTITIYRCAHWPEELNERFEEEFKECDIIFLESAWGFGYDEIKKHFNRLSRGEPTEYSISSPVFRDFMAKRNAFICGSGKPVELEKSRAYKTPDEMLAGSFGFYAGAFTNGNLEEACDLKLKWMKSGMEKMDVRDSDLIEQLAELQEENPGKTILCNLGSGHDIYYGLKRKGLDVKQVMPYTPYVFDLNDELARRIRYGKVCTKTDHARAFADWAINSYLYSMGHPTWERIKMARKISGQLGYDDVEELSKYISKYDWRQEAPAVATALWLQKKGFDI